MKKKEKWKTSLPNLSDFWECISKQCLHSDMGAMCSC